MPARSVLPDGCVMSTVAVSKGFSTVIFGRLEELLSESRWKLRHAKAAKHRQKMERQARIMVGIVMSISLKDHGTRTF